MDRVCTAGASETPPSDPRPDAASTHAPVSSIIDRHRFAASSRLRRVVLRRWEVGQPAACRQAAGRAFAE